MAIGRELLLVAEGMKYGIHNQYIYIDRERVLKCLGQACMVRVSEI